MKIFSVEQIRRLDKHTIEQAPIPSAELMERAAKTFVRWFAKKFPVAQFNKIIVVCGPGNNGGDGLAIARLLSREFYSVQAYLLRIGKSLSEDCNDSLKNLKKYSACPLVELGKDDYVPKIPPGCVVVDAIFGSGLTRPVEGWTANLIAHLNKHAVSRVAVDIPSGTFADQPTTGISFQADFTFTFELPKLAFFFPENGVSVGEWTAESIGLSQEFIQQEPTNQHFVNAALVKPLLKKRRKFDHKGTFGHALLAVGSLGKMGAGVLAAKACLRSGAGLATVHIPWCGYEIVQTALPEAMVVVDENETATSAFLEDFSAYKAIGAGCGWGTNQLTVNALRQILEITQASLVLDADALNILAAHPELLKKLPAKTILTPHPKEFERLFGATENGFERNQLQRQMAQELDIFIVLKGAYTCAACPDGSSFFNSTGNPGMATGGSGDVLTGILTGLLAQGYSQKEACLLGVFLHGLAGDLAAAQFGQEAMIAGDIVENLGKAFQKLRES